MLGIVVHQESVCATFGSGLSSACIVDVGDQKTSVCCVEDGVSHRNTRYLVICRIIISVSFIAYQRLDFKNRQFFYKYKVFLLWAVWQCHHATVLKNSDLFKRRKLAELILCSANYGGHDHSMSKMLLVFLCMPL